MWADYESFGSLFEVKRGEFSGLFSWAFAPLAVAVGSARVVGCSRLHIHYITISNLIPTLPFFLMNSNKLEFLCFDYPPRNITLFHLKPDSWRGDWRLKCFSNLPQQTCSTGNTAVFSEDKMHPAQIFWYQILRRNETQSWAQHRSMAPTAKFRCSFYPSNHCVGGGGGLFVDSWRALLLTGSV